MIFNLKRAVSLHLFAAAILAVPFFASCDKEEEIPAAEVVIKNEEGKVITGDTLQVKIGTGIHTDFLIIFHYNNDNKHKPFTITRQFDDNEPEDLTPQLNNDLEPTSMHADLSGGPTLISGEGYGHHKYNLKTAFSSKIVHVGSLVRISVCPSGGDCGTIYYKVVE